MKKHNKQEYFLKLYDPIAENLERFCLNLTRNIDDTKDLISETLMIAFDKLESIKDEKGFLSFLFTIAHRQFYKNLKEKKKYIYKDLNEFISMISSNQTPEEAHYIQVLYQALDKLDEQVREAIILFEIFGFKHKEIAKIQSTTIANIKIRVYRGKIKLKSYLENDINILKNEVK